MDLFSRNGQILPRDQAVVSLDSIEFTYGFGVYESLRVKAGRVLFLDQHIERLMASAKHIELDHSFSPADIADYITQLALKVTDPAFNLKVLLIGGRDAESANLYVLPLKPSFPDRKLYKTGAAAITANYERYLPHAKSLNMLPSYLAYRDAMKAGAYDALLINRRGEITEGTRTNFFALKGKTIISPPLEDVLEGVTLQNVLKVAKANSYELVEQPIKLTELDNNTSYFLTSTSSKVMPLASIDGHPFKIQQELKDLIKLFNEFLAAA